MDLRVCRPTFKEMVAKLTEMEGEFRRECHRQRSIAGSQAASGTATPAARSRRASGLTLAPSGPSGLGPPPRPLALSRLASTASGPDRLTQSVDPLEAL